MSVRVIQRLDATVPNSSRYSISGDHWSFPNFKRIPRATVKAIKSNEMFFALKDGIVIVTMSLDSLNIFDGDEVTLTIHASMEFRGTPVNKNIRIDFLVAGAGSNWYHKFDSTACSIRRPGPRGGMEYRLDYVFLCSKQNLANNPSLTTNDTLTIVPRFSLSTSAVTTDIVQVPIQATTLEDVYSINVLEQLFVDDQFADFVFSVQGIDFKVHKAIVAVRSTVFEAMIKHDMKEKAENRAEIPDVDPAVFKEMLRYIYTNEVENLGSIAAKLINVADKYNLRGLRNICEDDLSERLSPENVVELLQQADMFGYERLKAQTIGYITRNFTQVTDTEAWKNLTSSTPAKLISEVCFGLSQKIPSVPIEKSTLRKTSG